MIKIIKESINSLQTEKEPKEKTPKDLQNLYEEDENTLCGYDISHANLFTLEQFDEFMQTVINAKDEEV